MTQKIWLTTLIAAGTLAAALTIAPAAEKSTMRQQGTMKTTVAPPVKVPGGTVATELTSGECKGLGGSVETVNTVCNAKGQSACKTVDNDGVVRVACIDEVKN